jgi:branched-chain amino acid transport system permease protein
MSIDDVQSATNTQTRARWVLPRWAKFLGPAALAITTVAALFGSQIVVYQLSLIGIFAIAAVGQQWLMGRAGQASIGAAAFMGVGALTTAEIATQSWAVFPLPLIAGGLAGGIVGLLVGLTSIRLSGLYLLLSTLALQFIVQFVMLQVIPGGSVYVTAPSIGGFTIESGVPFAILVVFLLGLLCVFLWNLYQSPAGLAWNAIRSNEQAASVQAIGVTTWKLRAFIGSSIVTAIAGSLYAYLLQSVSGNAFSLNLTISLICMVFIGGQFTISGPILGAGLVSLLPYALSALQGQVTDPAIENWMSANGPIVSTAIYGAALVVVLLFERDGLAGLLASVRNAVARRISRSSEQKKVSKSDSRS